MSVGSSGAEGVPDDALLCYCTSLTIGELRAACAVGRWPLPGKEQTGKLCTGCVGDLLYCLRGLDQTAEARSIEDERANE